MPTTKKTSGELGAGRQLLSDACEKWLACVDERGATNAEKVALAMGQRALAGDVDAAREIRLATEGQLLTFDCLARVGSARRCRRRLLLSGAGPAAVATDSPMSADIPARPRNCR